MERGYFHKMRISTIISTTRMKQCNLAHNLTLHLYPLQTIIVKKYAKKYKLNVVLNELPITFQIVCQCQIFPCLVTASGPLNFCYSCVKNIKTNYKEQHHSMRIHGQFVLYPYSIHIPSCFQRYYHNTDTYTSHMQAYLYTLPNLHTDLPHLYC